VKVGGAGRARGLRSSACGLDGCSKRRTEGADLQRQEHGNTGGRRGEQHPAAGARRKLGDTLAAEGIVTGQ
jgi:hypothetical protein